MSFSKIRPAGWAVNSTMASSEIQQLDADHSNSAHSDNNPDTIASQWTFSSTASETFQNGSATTFQSGSTVNIQTANAFVGDGASNPGTIEVKSNGTLKADVGATETHANIVQIVGAGALLQTKTGGRVQLGDNDYPTFSLARSKVLTIQLGSTFTPLPSGWTSAATISPFSAIDGIAGPGGTGTLLTIPLLPYMVHNTNTLALVQVYFTPKTRTAGSAPSVGPSVAMLTRAVSTGAAWPLSWTNVASATMLPNAADYGNGNVHSWTLAPGASAINTANIYAIQITDESGSGVLAGNVYHAIQLTFNSADMTPA